MNLKPEIEVIRALGNPYWIYFQGKSFPYRYEVCSGITEYCGSYGWTKSAYDEYSHRDKTGCDISEKIRELIYE